MRTPQRRACANGLAHTGKALQGTAHQQAIKLAVDHSVLQHSTGMRGDCMRMLLPSTGSAADVSGPCSGPAPASSAPLLPSLHCTYLLWVLRARIKHVELRLQARHHKLVHGDVSPVKLHAAHAVLHVHLPTQLQHSGRNKTNMWHVSVGVHGIVCGVYRTGRCTHSFFPSSPTAAAAKDQAEHARRERGQVHSIYSTSRCTTLFLASVSHCSREST
jgi:hypothetical protein